MATIPPPPSYVSPIGLDQATQKPYFEPAWLQWFLDLAQILSQAGGTGGINHEDLASLFGGAAGDHWHLTQTQHDALVDASTAAVVTPAVGASPWTYQNATGYRVYGVIVGGTVTNVELSRDNATFYSAGVSQVIVLSNSDYLRLTYAVAPVLALFPL